MTPRDLGLPFDSWRPGQLEAAVQIATTDKPFVALIPPTGAGKSLMYMGALTLLGGTAAALTRTRALMEQIGRDFHLPEIKGRNAYPCLALAPGGELDHLRPVFGARTSNCDEGPCISRIACSLKGQGCRYFDALAEARRSPVISSNYACWLAQWRYGQGLGYGSAARRVLVCDEAHDLFDTLAESISVSLSLGRLKAFGPPTSPDLASWGTWARTTQPLVVRQLLEHGPLDDDAELSAEIPEPAYRRARQLTQLYTQLRAVELAADHPDRYVIEIEGTPPARVTLHNIWPTREDLTTYLLRGAEKTILVSATLSRKTVMMLGIDPDREVEWIDSFEGFDPRSRPVYSWPVARNQYSASEYDRFQIVTAIDQIIRGRQDRKGIIHTVSYARQQEIVKRSEWSRHMYIHTSARALPEALARFREAQPPAILVSPSVTTGHDFPGDQCEYIVFPKLPWPHTKSPIMEARKARDREYPAYLAMQEIVQGSGRGTRRAEDRCEVFILDAHWGQWFAATYRAFAPEWFWAAHKRVTQVPDPPQKAGGVAQRRAQS